MSRKSLKNLGTLIMFLLLLISSPKWLNPTNQLKSNYDAPWIYPGLKN